MNLSTRVVIFETSDVVALSESTLHNGFRHTIFWMSNGIVVCITRGWCIWKYIHIGVQWGMRPNFNIVPQGPFRKVETLSSRPFFFQLKSIWSQEKVFIDWDSCQSFFLKICRLWIQHSTKYSKTAYLQKSTKIISND